MTPAPRQLLAFTFPPGSGFEGQLVGALERIESGGTMRVLDGLFVAREPQSGELVAVTLGADGPAGMIGPLLSFRLDESARKRATEHALQGRAGDVVRSLASTLEPGGAIAAVLVEHAWALALDEAITRIGGSQLANEFVDPTGVADVSACLASAMSV